MCNLSQPQVPRGWQRVCQKAKMPLESRDPCSLFLSPNGKTFKTMDEVHRYSKVLHLEKLAREQKKMEAKNNYFLTISRGNFIYVCRGMVHNYPKS